MRETSHIKNPLTVIAIFAGLAELGGTAVLPVLEPATQAVYVWFLMLFPALLVGLFFHMLWYKHTHLYAPSDFKDETHFVAAAAPDVLRKLEQDALDAAKEPIEKPVENQIVDEGRSDNKADETEHDFMDVLPSTSASSATHDFSLSKSKLGYYLKLEELVVARLQRELGSLIGRSVRPTDLPNVVFDAVYTTGSRTTVVEIKFSRNGEIPIKSLLRTFISVKSFYETLPSHEQGYLECLFAIVTENSISDGEIKKLEGRLVNLGAAYPFRVKATYISLEELVHGGSETVFD